MGEKPRNAMQAVLDRAGQQAPDSRPRPRAVASTGALPAPSVDGPRFDRPSRRNTKLIGGHFSPELAKQMRMLAAEEDTTIQALLEEAIQLLLAKKARISTKAVR
jgi:hypothetical protein